MDVSDHGYQQQSKERIAEPNERHADADAMIDNDSLEYLDHARVPIRSA